MTDLSQLSDEELRLQYNSMRPLSELSDDELRKLHSAQTKELLRLSRPSEYNPAVPSYQEKYGPLANRDSGAINTARAGAGKAFYDIGRGASQLAGGMTREQVDTSRALDSALMRSTAGKVGDIGGNVTIAAPTMFIPGANTYTGSALIGAGLGALQPVGTQDSRTQNMLLGTAGGVAGKFVGNRISNWAAAPRMTPVALADAESAAHAGAAAQVAPGQALAENTVSAAPELRVTGGGPNFGTVGEDASAGLTPPQQQIMRRFQAMGGRMTPGQATGSRSLQQLEAKLESQPMTSGPFNTLKAGNSRVVNRAAARAIGETADTLDSAVLDRAEQRIGNVFDNAGDDAARTISPDDFLQRYIAIQDDVRGLVNGFNDEPLVKDVMDYAAEGTATGRQLQSLTSKLGKAAYKNMTTPAGDRDLGMALYQVKDYVDDLLQQGMSEARARTFQQARTQYRNLMLLTSRTSVVNPSTGNVAGRSLANVLQMKDKAGFTYGRNQSDMYAAAHAAQAFAPIVGDSGTATRTPFSGMTDIAMRLPMSLASRAYTSSPAVNLAMRAQAGAQAAGRAVAPASNALRAGLGAAPFYAPYLLPEVGAGIMAGYAQGQ